MALTVGTAGHIDHGKTWLVRALTGKDTDRLPEEQRRGISIDLGYAPLELPDGRRLSLVDVPGHERFVRTMVAGATGIDLFLLVIDAAEGARPQTLEHLAILRLLGVDARRRRRHQGRPGRRGDARARARGGARARAGGRGRRGQRQDRRRPRRAPRGARAGRRRGAGRDADGPARLYVDRVFTLRGHRHGRHRHALVGLDRRGRRAARRAARRRGARAQRAGARPRRRARDRRASASRSACPGVERRELHRGDALVTPGAFPVSYRLDVELEELAPIESGARVSVHHGTSRDRGPGGAGRRARRAAAARRARRRGARRPRRPARGDDARRRDACSTRRRRGGSTRSGSSCSSSGDPASIVRRDGRRAGRDRSARGARAALAGRARAGPRRRSIAPAAGRSRATGSTRPAASIVERLEARAEESPLDPGLAGRGAPAGGAVGAGDPRRCCRSSGEAGWHTCRRRSIARRARGGRRKRSGASSRRPAWRPSRWRTRELARYLEADGGLVRLGDGFAVVARTRTAGARTRRRGVPSSRGDRACAIPRPGRRRSPRRAAPARAARPGRRHAPARRSPHPASRRARERIAPPMSRARAARGSPGCERDQTRGRCVTVSCSTSGR